MPSYNKILKAVHFLLSNNKEDTLLKLKAVCPSVVNSSWWDKKNRKSTNELSEHVTAYLMSDNGKWDAFKTVKIRYYQNADNYTSDDLISRQIENLDINKTLTKSGGGGDDEKEKLWVTILNLISGKKTSTTTATEKKVNIGSIIGLVLILGVAGGIFYFLFKK
jgi:hypothetical protein